mmetsp:Transcript_21314/g.55404  ORF Transcript_21314/g.55404 Transcript_21314/m.55404 type:complete len:120 (-) Transcript_21314:163-522(-)
MLNAFEFLKEEEKRQSGRHPTKALRVGDRRFRPAVHHSEKMPAGDMVVMKDPAMEDLVDALPGPESDNSKRVREKQVSAESFRLSQLRRKAAKSPLVAKRGAVRNSKAVRRMGGIQQPR